MSERRFSLRIEVAEENDGARYLRRGAEKTNELLDLATAISRYGREKIQRLLKETISEVEGEICRVHDEDDPVPGRICGRPLPCRDHSDEECECPVEGHMTKCGRNVLAKMTSG